MAEKEDAAAVPSFTSTRDHLAKTIQETKKKAVLVAERSTHAAFSFVSIILTLVLVLAVAIFLYLTFYYAYMPVDIYKLPINFQFEPCNSTETIQKCSHLKGQATLGRGQSLSQGQTYSMNIHLVLPDNSVNEDHGMFMTCLTLSSRRGEFVDKSCKSAMMQYRSWLLRMIDTVVFSPALVTGYYHQRQDIHINFFNDFQTDPRTPGEALTVEIMSRHLQIFEASLEITAELRGIRHLMYRHPWISAIVGVGSNITVLLTIILISWTRFLSSDSLTQEDADNNNDDDHEDCETEEDDLSVRSFNYVQDISGERLFSNSDAIVSSNSRPKTSIIGSLIKSSVKLLLFTVLCLLAMSAYHHQEYEVSKLVEITIQDVKSFMTNQENNEMFNIGSKFVSDFMAIISDWDNIFVKVLAIKFVTIIILSILMSLLRIIT